MPGAIQPHGLLLLADPATLRVIAVAGDVESRLDPAWAGRPLEELIGPSCAKRAAATRVEPLFVGRVTSGAGEVFDASAHLSSAGVVVELEASDAASTHLGQLLGEIEAVSAEFERASTVEALCAIAAEEFRKITGYARVMVYRFLDDDSGSVIGEARAPDMRAFMNHRFPATDIPRQARALYLRNRIRVIPNVGYAPAPLRFADDAREVDLSGSSLRSVSPIHIQYLKNMGVGASASVSIVRDGVLWGLIACHHDGPREIGFEARAAARTLAGALGRQLRAKDEADAFRERVRLRSFQDDLTSLLSREGSLENAISNHADEIRRALGGDGVAVLRGRDLITSGRCPGDGEVRALARWALKRSSEQVFSTDRLAEIYPTAAGFQNLAAGLLSITLSVTDPWVVMWFRAEQVEIVEWAGNPHKDDDLHDPDQILTPRASFEVWRETVLGRSRRWTPAELEAAGRLRSAVIEVWQSRGLVELNRRLVATIEEKDLLIQQKEFLIGEVNHRVQNSLQLVSSFLALQGRSSNQPGLAPALEEARRRLTAVALVHRRLYRSDQVESVDIARYLDELIADVVASLGDNWANALTIDLAPILMPTDRAISVGLILTELMINATKYAYGGGAGPLAITITEDRAAFRLTVADRGVGAPEGGRRGFGSRMMDALVRQIGGEMTREDNRPGLRVTLVADVVGTRESAAGSGPAGAVADAGR